MASLHNIRSRTLAGGRTLPLAGCNQVETGRIDQTRGFLTRSWGLFDPVDKSAGSVDNVSDNMWTAAAKSRACARLLSFLRNNNISILVIGFFSGRHLCLPVCGPARVTNSNSFGVSRRCLFI